MGIGKGFLKRDQERRMEKVWLDWCELDIMDEERGDGILESEFEGTTAGVWERCIVAHVWNRDENS
jgi:hypothetical protein